MQNLKYLGYAVTFQEVPNEVSLVFNLSGCRHQCEGCHSPELREDIGQPLLEDMTAYIDRYRDMITCVCFMGGDHNLQELETALRMVKKRKLKTCVYSGGESLYPFEPLYRWIDYLKIGPYREDLGGLASPTTNQVMYRIYSNGRLDDITHIFWRGHNGPAV